MSDRSGVGIGGALPRHPRITRKIPAPFQRPQVAIGVEVRREWRTVCADRLSPGDTVPEVGQVVSVAVADHVVLEGLDGTTKTVDVGTLVFAFTGAESDAPTP